MRAMKAPLLVAALALSAVAPEPTRPYGQRPPQKGVSRAERERRKAKKRAAKASQRRNRP